MSRHEGVSCDSCLKNNFSGHRYKCLVCYDYDLCSSCHDSGATTARHLSSHAMQCILTKVDQDLFYGGESGSHNSTTSYTCPYCAKIGFSECGLHEHVIAQHPSGGTGQDVICPLCAALVGGNSNYVTINFATHLAQGHGEAAFSASHRDLISFVDEPGGGRGRVSATRRSQVSNTRCGLSRQGGTRIRRPTTSYNAPVSATLSPLSLRRNDDSVDAIAELLSQLSGARRATNVLSTASGGTPVTRANSASELQHLHLQLERQLANRRHERLSRTRNNPTTGLNTTGTAKVKLTTAMASSLVSQRGAVDVSVENHGGAQKITASSNNRCSTDVIQSENGDNFLLHDSSSDEDVTPSEEQRRVRKCQFIQELVLSSLIRGLKPKLEDEKSVADTIDDDKQENNAT